MMVDEDVVYLCPSTVYHILDRHDLFYRWIRSTAVGVPPAKAQKTKRTMAYRYSLLVCNESLVFSLLADDVLDVIEEALEKTPGA